MDKNHCFYCEKRFSSTKVKGITVGAGIIIETRDHIIPRSKGGSNKAINKIPCCSGCNKDKNDFLPEEFLDRMQKRLSRYMVGTTAYNHYAVVVKNVTALIKKITPFRDTLYKDKEPSSQGWLKDMPACIEYKCHCQRMCYVLNQCVFTHPLVEGHHFRVKDLLRGNLKEGNRTARILQFFEEQQPPKYLQYSKKTKKVYPTKKAKGMTTKEIRKEEIKKSTVKPHEPNPDHPDFYYVTGRTETISQFLDRMNLNNTPNFHIDK